MTSTAALAAPKVTFKTNLGTIVLTLNSEKAPKTVANFVEYVESGFYDGTIFHRVIPGFVIQGGGFSADFDQKPTRDPIPNESDNGLDNAHYTISMARTSDPDSATSQFFINLSDNTPLDAHNGQPGYAVFGKVTEGQDVVDKIATIQTGAGGPFPQDVPQQTVVIEKATVDAADAK